jgi:hypothetical protein
MQAIPVPSALAPFQARWVTFADKIRARAREVENEAVAAYREVISIDVVDGTGMTGVSNALKARLLGLRKKIDEAFEKIDGEMDAVDNDDSRGHAYFRASLSSARRALDRELERLTETIIVYGEAECARALQKLAFAEIDAPLACQQCGAALKRTSWHQTVNVTCASCRAVTTATPGTAGTMFAAGAGAYALAFEAALPKWYARQDAEHVWHSLRHRTLDDLGRWEAANRAYYQAFAEAMPQFHPGWTAKTVEDEVRGKMSQFMEHDAKNDRVERENMGAGVAAVGSNDPGQVQAWIGRQRDPDGAREELVTAFVERGWLDHARWIAQLTGLPGDELADIEYRVATRGD